MPDHEHEHEHETNLVHSFFTNWSDSDLPLKRRLAVTLRNRARAARRGCCGHHGEPGC